MKPHRQDRAIDNNVNTCSSAKVGNVSDHVPLLQEMLHDERVIVGMQDGR